MKSESIAATLALTSWAAVVPAFFHHFLPLACWFTGFICFLLMSKESQA